MKKCCAGVVFGKVAGWNPVTLLSKRDSSNGVFFCQIGETLKKTPFTEHLRTTAFGNKIYVKKFSSHFEVSQSVLLKMFQKQPQEVLCKKRYS